MVVVVLDRIFDRDDVLVAVNVDPIQHRRKGCCLTRTRRPGHQDQTTWPRQEVQADLGQAELVHVVQFLWDHTHHRAIETLLSKHADTEAITRVMGEAEIGTTDLL